MIIFAICAEPERPNVDGYELRLIEDNLASGGALALPADGINRVIYVAHGAVSIAGQTPAATGWQRRGAARVSAGSTGAALWRWEWRREAPRARCGAGWSPTSNCVVLVADAESLLMRWTA